LCVAAVLVTGIATAPLRAPAVTAAALVALGATVASGGLRRVARAAPAAVLFATATTLPIAWARGLEAALFTAVRAACAIATAVAVAGAIPRERLGPALRGIGVPAALAAVVAAALRQMAELREEGQRLLLARRLRGRAGYKGGANLVGVLFLRAARRAERVELALRLRGASTERALTAARLSPGDAPFVALSFFAALAIHLSAWIAGILPH
jgi:energy-coupling factor transporter transmembrane protein EcfT